jgi:sugar lactone lactonase YvrE
MNEPKHLVPVQNKLGETPIWDPEENALYWVDWGGGPVWRYEPGTGKSASFPVSLPVTALARSAPGRLIAIAQQGVYEWDLGTNDYSLLVGPPEAGKPDICFNDGAVDRQGRLLLGTVNMQDVFAPDGSLYRLDPDGSLHELDRGYATANGLGVSPDGTKLYVTDMRHNQIIALDYDPLSGAVSSRRIFARVPAEDGMPDGLIVDAEGFVWSGHWAGWKLTRYDPDGKIERQIRFPVQHVISFGFGGKDLDILFVTTAWWGLSEEERKRQPFAGDLFRINTGVQGLVEPAFTGKPILQAGSVQP